MDLVVNAGHGMWVKKCSLSPLYLVSDLEDRPGWMGGKVFPSSVVWVGEKKGVALSWRGEEGIDVLFEGGEVEEGIPPSRIVVKRGLEPLEQRLVQVGGHCPESEELEEGGRKFGG